MTSEYQKKKKIYIYYQDESLKIKTNTILNQNRRFVRRGLYCPLKHEILVKQKHTSIFSFICMFCRSLFVLLSFFLLAIVLSVLLRYTDSDYLFGIFKLFSSLNRHGNSFCEINHIVNVIIAEKSN